MPKTYLERFWAKVLIIDDEDSCWLWNAAMSGEYGRFGVHPGSVMGAHVYSYTLAYGPVPQGKDVLHTCNVKYCVRPSHLYAGTQSQNGIDAVRDGVMNNVLTPAQVQDIRALYSLGGYTQTQLAAMYNVGQSTISAVVTGTTWGWVE